MIKNTPIHGILFFVRGFRMLNRITDVPRAIRREGNKFLYFLPYLLLLLLFFVIPYVKHFASFFWIAFGCWMMSVEYTDYIFELQRKSFKATLAFLRHHFFAALGFGFITLLFSMIPIVSLLVIPTAVIGSTLMMIESQN